MNVGMQVVEQFIAGKHNNQADCEDGIVVTDGLAAVIDGSTDKTGDRYGGETGGKFAMRVCSDALRSLDASANARAAAAHLTMAIANQIRSDTPPQHRPAAALAVYSQARRELWQIGDVGIWHVGLPSGGIRPGKRIDRYAATLRSAILQTELSSGATVSELQDDDPGRTAIVPLLTGGAVFCNNLGAGAWAYAAVNGSPIPDKLISIRRVPDEVAEIVLASDGYPRIMPTLTNSEHDLAALLAEDPLCIGPLLGTKGMQAGSTSYDDRAYLRVRIGSTATQDMSVTVMPAGS